MEGYEAQQRARIQPDLVKLEKKETRLEAIVSLGQSRSVEAIEPLLDLCRRANEQEREAICEALAGIALAAPTGAATRSLVALGVGSKHQRVQRCAICALASIGQDAQPVVDELLGYLKDEEHLPSGLRPQGLAALGKIGGTAVEAYLRQVASDRSKPSLARLAALEALQTLLQDAIVPAAAALLDDEDAKLRRYAVRCLFDVETDESTDHLVELYLASSEQDRARAAVLKELRSRHKHLVERIRAGEQKTLPVLLDVWRGMGKKQAEEAKEILLSLIEIGHPLVPALCAELDPSLPGADVIRVLEHMGSERLGAAESTDVLSTLVAQLDNADVATCCAAARGLGTLGDERAIPALADCLTFDNRLLQAKKRREKRTLKRARALQRAAAVGLGRLGKVALPVALRAAGSDDPVSRCGGVMALGRIGGGRATSVVHQATEDSEAMVREAAATAMELIGTGDVHRLSAMLRNPDEKVRAKAVKALGKLQDLRSLDLLLRAYGDPSKRVNRAVVKALARREGGRPCSVLVAAAAGGNVSALRALEKQPTTRAIPALIEALDSPWSEARGVALHTFRTYAKTLAQEPDVALALRQGVPELLSLLHDDAAAVRRMALDTLGLLGESQSTRDIVLLLLDAKRDVRRAAVRALESIGGDGAIAALQGFVDNRSPDRSAGDRELYEQAAGALARLRDVMEKSPASAAGEESSESHQK